MGALSMAIPAKYGLAAATGTGSDGTPLTNSDAPTVLLVLAVGACLTGAANAVRELIKERVIYERERAAGLSRSAYMMSKVIVLGAITALQTVVLAALCLRRASSTSGLVFGGSAVPEMMIAVMLLGITSMMLGLVVSAVVKTSEKTMPLLVLIAIVEVVFCGSMFPLFGKPALEQSPGSRPPAGRWPPSPRRSTCPRSWDRRRARAPRTRSGSTPSASGSSTPACSSPWASPAASWCSGCCAWHEPQAMRAC